MDYFFELASQENDGKFIVPHSKLIEYGIATSGQSNHVKDRMIALGLTESEEFNLGIVSQIKFFTHEAKYKPFPHMSPGQSIAFFN
jgi:hypothetical protein